MNTIKTTYIDALNYALANLADAPQEIVDKLAALRAQYENRKNYTSPKDKADAESDVNARERILYILSTKGKMTAPDILAADPTVAKSTQKITSLVKPLIDSGKIVKTLENRRAYYAIAE